MSNPFDGLADRYQQYRPEYPEAILKTLHDLAASGPAAARRTIVDVGAGTGIATRALRRVFGDGWQVVGLEPGADMRRRAEEMPMAGLRYIDGDAEALPFDDGSITAVAVAQAIQFFDRPVFYAEACRVLDEGGVLAVLQNNRQWKASRLLDAYESFVEEHDPGYSRDYRDIDLLGEFRALPWGRNAARAAETWTRPMDADGFVGMTLSRRTMKPVVAKLGEPAVESALRAMCAANAGSGGMVEVPYVTELFTVVRP